MPSNYNASNGQDLDDVFDPIVDVADKHGSAVGYQVGGQDLNDRYVKLSRGSQAGATGLLVNGADLNTIFALKGSVSYYTNGEYGVAVERVFFQNPVSIPFLGTTYYKLGTSLEINPSSPISGGPTDFVEVWGGRLNAPGGGLDPDGSTIVWYCLINSSGHIIFDCYGRVEEYYLGPTSSMSGEATFSTGACSTPDPFWWNGKTLSFIQSPEYGDTTTWSNIVSNFTPGLVS